MLTRLHYLRVRCRLSPNEVKYASWKRAQSEATANLIRSRGFTACSVKRDAAGTRFSLNKIIEDFNTTATFPTATSEVRDLDGQSADLAGKDCVLHGYLTTQRKASSKLLFAELTAVDGLHAVQLKCLSSGTEHGLREKFGAIRPSTPVAVTGVIETRAAPPSTGQLTAVSRISKVEINVKDVQALNDFPKDVIVAAGTVIPAEQRHLQLRTEKRLRDGILFRSRVCQSVRAFLCGQHEFVDIETPLLFKSTPEGAHEFLVPTRTFGEAYSLPQSPQQYKQILMASGIPRYMQIAKCFRDEDLRADRQPEFTQIDLEMSFAGEEQVMQIVEDLVKTLWNDLLGTDLWADRFPRITYEEAMSKYGSDKPDTRLGSEIARIDYMIPVDLISKVSGLHEPAVEVFKLSVSTDPRTTAKFVASFMERADARPYIENPDGQPGIFIFDAKKPLSGLQPFGFEAAETLEEQLQLDSGDLVIIQARPNKPFTGGATVIGNLRLALHKAAVAAGLIDKPTGWNFLWVTSFPLFTPATADTPSAARSPITSDVDPSSLDATSAPSSSPLQLNRLESTHHPFTAPATPDDATLLLSKPHAARAAHYDLVLNGVELGGGSRRIHHAGMQRLVLEELLQLSPERMQDFEHLLQVLRAGCPPHAGMALGLDRLVMLMLGRESVRDVIAFPKSGRGEDLLVKAPSRVGREAWARYGLRLVDDA